MSHLCLENSDKVLRAIAHVGLVHVEACGVCGKIRFETDGVTSWRHLYSDEQRAPFTSEEVECGPCSHVNFTGDICGATLMVKHSSGHCWCPVCGARREVGAEVVPERPTPPHGSAPSRTASKHDRIPRSL